jgi:NAD(P)-dependent dehydrogenase (short-subunit alcohol dehydrogenase family)
MREPTLNAEPHRAASMHLEGIDGRVAVVTGAAGGIGHRVATTLAALGARVAGIDLRGPGPEGTLLCEVDVCDPGAVAAAFDEIERTLGDVEILVTSAGVFRPAALDALDPGAWDRTLAINLKGTFLCVQRAAASMRARGGGRIVTISSGAGIDGGDRDCADYAASKGGVIAFTKAASKELVRAGVTVNCVAPRNIATEMLAGLEDELAAEVPVGRLGTVDDVAAAVAFLASAHAGYITGEVLVMNGGAW